MSVQALFLVDPVHAGRGRVTPWQRALLVPIPSEPAVFEYCRLTAEWFCSTRLIVPTCLLARLPAQSFHDLAVHTYCRSFGDGSFSRVEPVATTSETVIVNASRLPEIDLASSLSLHRGSGAGMTLFYGPGQRDYCRERIASDASGIVKTAVRQYADSSLRDCRADPVAMILSRRIFRPDPASRISSFAQLASHLQERVQRAGERMNCIRHTAVQCHISPLEALLWLVERVSQSCEPNPCVYADVAAPGTRLRGSVRIGRGVRIGPGALIIGPSSLGDGAVIGAGAVVSRTIILPGEAVAENGHCHNRVIGPDGECFSESTMPVDVTRDPCDEQPASLSPAGERFKRIFDVVAATIGLVLLSPVFAVTALAIKLTSAGPVLFRHRRQGRDGVEFDCLKFRTMGRDADALQTKLQARNQVDGPQFKIENDPRVTLVGGWLRRTNVDELPQLFNVLAGQMSLVGPRPSPDRENQFCPTWRKARLSVRPGITGLWQVARSKDRHLTDFQEWIYYDTRYVENRSFWLDLQIIWQTLRVLLHLGPYPRWHARWQPRHAPLPPTISAQLPPVQPAPGLIST